MYGGLVSSSELVASGGLVVYGGLVSSSELVASGGLVGVHLH